MRLKVKEFFSFLVALAFLVGWVAGANAGFKPDWSTVARPATDSSVSYNNTQVCQDSSGNIGIVWDNGTNVYMQKISPTGLRLFLEEVGAATYGLTVLDRSGNLTLQGATCLDDGSVFVVADNSTNYYMQLVSPDGERQWGLDASHKYGKELIDHANVKTIALLPLSNSVAVAYGNDTDTYYTIVDTAGNKDCGGQDWCDVGFASNSTLSLVPAGSTSFWLVGVYNGTDLKIFGVSGDTVEEANSTTAASTIKAISDGNGGVVVFNGNNVIRVCGLGSKSSQSIAADITLTSNSSVQRYGDYVYVDNGTKVCKYELVEDCSNPGSVFSRVWCTKSTDDVSNNGTMALVDGKLVLTKVESNDVNATLVDDSDGDKIFAGVVLSSGQKGMGNPINNLAVFPGSNSAYAVFEDTTGVAVMKFSWALKPNFVITLGSVSGDVSTADDWPVTVQFTANNTGAVDASSDVVVKFYLTNSTSITNLTDWSAAKKVYVGETMVSASDLAAGKGKTLTTTFDVSKEAVNELMNQIDNTTVYMAAVINEGKVVDEDPYDKDNISLNNSTSITVYAPNLQFAGGSCDYSPKTGDLKPGDTITITCTAQNSGTAATPTDIEVAFKYSGKILKTTTLASLAALEQREFSENVTIPTSVNATSFNITAELDPNKLIGESNETDNTANATITVSDIGPDLVVEAAAITPVTINAGGQATASFVIKNVGGQDAGASIVKLFLSEDESFDASDRFLAGKAIGSITPNGSVADTIEKVNIPDDINAGTYYVLFVADAGNSVDELNENNNVYAQQITVTGGAGATCPEITLVVSNVGGYAEIWVAVPSCGDYCGFPATVAIQADLDGDSAVDYSFVPGMGYYGWIEGESTFVFTLTEVSPVAILDDWMGVSYSTLSNATITFNVQVGECNVTETWTP